MPRRLLALMSLIVLLVACQKSDDTPLPTIIDPVAVSTERAANNTATAIMLMTLTPATSTPTLTATPSNTPLTPTLTPTYTPSQTRTATPTITWTPSHTPTPFATLQEFQPESPTPTITNTPTASDTPTRVLNPDALVGGVPAPLRVSPDDTAASITDLPAGTALGIDARTTDEGWALVSLLNGRGNGWVDVDLLIVLIDFKAVPIYSEDDGSGTQQQASTPTAQLFTIQDLAEPQHIDPNNLGDGLPFSPYNYTACADTYWEGDGTGFSMEDLVVAGRYPRFAVDPVKVYVYGLDDLLGDDRGEWELAISQAFAEIGQGVRLERVFLDDLAFFHPWVPMSTILADRRVDMVWHIVPQEDFALNAICTDGSACAQYAFDGAVMGGPLNFGSAIYTHQDVQNKQQVLVHAALHALGLWVHSSHPEDLLAGNSRAQRLSPRDIQTLRCLYNAPPYGDAVID